MAIICQDKGVTIGLSYVTICGISFKIDDIKPESTETIIVTIGSEFFYVTTGGTGYGRNNHYWSFKLISKNVNANTAVINFTNSDNPCYNITCPDTCVGNDLYTQKCSVNVNDDWIPINYSCVTNTLKTPNYPACMTTGSISCSTTPSGASVYLDNVDQSSVTPITLTNVSTGSHTVTYKLTGYNDCNVDVTVIAGGTVNAPCTMVETPTEIYEKSYTFNFSVPSFYPTWYINKVVWTLNTLGVVSEKLISLINPNEFKLTSITFNESTYLMKFLITNKTVPLSLESNLYSNLHHKSEYTIHPLIGPGIVLVPATIEGIINLIAFLVVGFGLILTFFSQKTEKVGEVASEISYNIIPMLCGKSSSLDDDIDIVYACDENTPGKISITAGNNGIIVCKSDVTTLNITATSKKYGSTTVKATPKNLNVILCFKDEGRATINVEADKCSAFVITEQNSDGNLVTRIIKALDGKLDTTINTGQACISSIPCDLVNYVPKEATCDKFTKDIPVKLTVVYEQCVLAKNKIYVNTLFIPSGLTKQDAIGFIPSKVKLMNGTTIIQEKIPTTSLVLFEKVDVDINYNIVIESTDYIQTESLTAKFTYDPSKPETLCGNGLTKDLFANSVNTSYSITFDVKDESTTLPIINARVILNGDRVKPYLTTLSGQVSFYLQKVNDKSHKIIIEATGYKTIEFDYSPTSSTIVYKTLQSSIIQALYITRFSYLEPSTTLNAGGIVKFKGKLEGYKNNEWVALSEAKVYVKITDVSNNEIRTSTSTTAYGGIFETGEWLIPKDLSNKEINVTTTFDATGDYKTATPFSTSYVVGEGCCLSLPFIGCIATQSTCNALKTGAYICGGLLIGYIGLKVYKSLTPK